MGLSKKRKAEFLKENTICCFCGGGRASEEPDHIPSRAMFDDKQWPEGYEFPACIECNRETRHDENVVAMLSRLYPDGGTEKQRKEFEKYFRAIYRNYPALVAELKATTRQKRNAISKYNIELPEGQPKANFAAFNVSGPLVNGAIYNFARKLFLALYYKHSGEILDHDGGIALRWYSNLQISNDEIPRELAHYTTNYPKLERSRTNLDDQFFYRYSFSTNGNMAIFIAFFRRSFAILGAINKNAKELDLPEDANVFGPYNRD